MQRFFSPSTGGFYSEDIHGRRMIDVAGQTLANPDCRIPEDAIEVAEAQWRDLLIATSEGKVLAVIDSQVTAVDREEDKPGAGEG